MDLGGALAGAVAGVAVLLLVGVHLYAIFHALEHRRFGMALLLFASPGLAWLWIPLHHHAPAAVS